MASLSENDAAKAIEAAQDLDRALLPVLGVYDDGTLATSDVQAWEDAGAAHVLARTRGLIDRALKNLARVEP
jgi:hypothetical protein